MNSLLLILFWRLERNQEREKESANLEYMKNVILQFLKCRPNEREHLVPVLTTMLKLSQDEKELIVQLARGMMWIHEVTLKMNLYQSFCISNQALPHHIYGLQCTRFTTCFILDRAFIRQLLKHGREARSLFEPVKITDAVFNRRFFLRATSHTLHRTIRSRNVRKVTLSLPRSRW